MTLRIVVLGVIASSLAGPGRALLVRARWTERTPRSAILLWQALGAAVVTALVGICVEAIRAAEPTALPRRAITDYTAHATVVAPQGGMTPLQLFVLTAALIAGTLAAGAVLCRLVGHARVRARQRLLIDLLVSERPQLPGTLVLPSPHPTAFSLPGVRSRVVVSTGALATLADDELSAVLRHEHAHVRARHDLVLLPFRSLASVLPRSRAVGRVHDDVSALVEMAADDRVVHDLDATVLARALCRLATSVPPATALVASTSATSRRVERALEGRRPAPTLALGSVLSAGAVLALPVMALLLPVGR